MFDSEIWVIYHSTKWELLVETGWVTMYVLENQWARMLRIK